MGDKKFLGKHLTACLTFCIHIAVFVLGTEFLLLIKVPLPAGCIVGIEVDAELADFACIVEIGLSCRRVLVPSDATVLQVVVWFSVGRQVIIIFAASLHVVVGVLVESAERVVVVDLVIKAESTFQERIANIILLLIVNHPERIGKDRLFKLATAFPPVICPKEVSEKFQSTRPISQIDPLIIGIATPTARPR